MSLILAQLCLFLPYFWAEAFGLRGFDFLRRRCNNCGGVQ
jgi:hypothetical protein